MMIYFIVSYINAYKVIIMSQYKLIYYSAIIKKQILPLLVTMKSENNVLNEIKEKKKYITYIIHIYVE